jgi:hypothetical protein
MEAKMIENFLVIARLEFLHNDVLTVSTEARLIDMGVNLNDFYKE